MDIISTRICKFRKNAANAAIVPDITVATRGVPVSWKIELKNLQSVNFYHYYEITSNNLISRIRFLFYFIFF